MIKLLYIDPGSGTIILQLLLAGIAGIIAYSKRIRHAVSNFFAKFKKKK